MNNKIVVPAGYMGSGSSAVTDLLSEIEGYEKNSGSFEYVFLHCPDGVFDLEDKLLRGNNALRSDEAIHRFQACMNDLYDKRFYWVSGYRNIISEKFMEYVDEFLKDINTFEMQDVYWYFQENPTTRQLMRKNFVKRVLQKLTKKKVVLKQPLRYDKMHWAFPTEKEFYAAAQKFLKTIWQEMGIDSHNLVLDQLLLPHNLFRLNDYFDETVRVVVVDRDPRDVFLLNKYFWTKNGGVVPYPTDVNDFCDMYLRMRNNEDSYDDKRILRMHFEDLIYNYEESLEKIYKLLDVTEKEHCNRKKSIFKPEVSINNTRIFMLEDMNADEVAIIEQRLTAFLYPFPKTEMNTHDVKTVF